MRTRPLLALLAAGTVLVGCSADSDDTDPPDTADDIGGTLTVFAAASLTDVFTELGDELEDRYPGLDVQFSFAGSSALAGQLEQGAPADVFASADAAQMTRLEDVGLVDDADVYARN